MEVWIYALASVSLVSLVSLIGIITLGLGQKLLRGIVLYLVSFAVGALFGDAFIHLVPASFEQLGTGLKTSLLLLGGILIFFVL